MKSAKIANHCKSIIEVVLEKLKPSKNKINHKNSSILYPAASSISLIQSVTKCDVFKLCKWLNKRRRSNWPHGLDSGPVQMFQTNEWRLWRMWAGGRCTSVKVKVKITRRLLNCHWVKMSYWTKQNRNWLNCRLVTQW